MGKNKVQGGTPTGVESRCDTCNFGLVIRGYAESEKITICTRADPAVPVRFAVAECTSYSDTRIPCLYELEKIALDLTKEKTGRAGIRAVPTRAEELELVGAGVRDET